MDLIKVKELANESVKKRIFKPKENVELSEGHYYGFIYGYQQAIKDMSEKAKSETSDSGLNLDPVIESDCDCYKYTYGESGKRRWCTECGTEDIGF